MKLTKTMREAFVRAVMADVPQEDYDAQAHAVAHKHLKEVTDKLLPGLDLQVLHDAGMIERKFYRMPGALRSAAAFGPGDQYGYFRAGSASPEVVHELTRISELKRAQAASRDDLERKLGSVALSCTTRKALAAALPEFEKYLPEDEPKAIRSLPVVANVVTDFVRAGWPKGGQQ